MADAYLAMLSTIMPAIRLLTVSPDAIVFYEMLSGSLIWTDEIPNADDAPPNCAEYLRPVFRFRTSIILGDPEERYRDFWDEAVRLFPEWPGLLPARRVESYKVLYCELKASAMAQVDSLFDPIESKKRAP